jgi:hypothetical protein
VSSSSLSSRRHRGLSCSDGKVLGGQKSGPWGGAGGIGARLIEGGVSCYDGVSIEGGMARGNDDWVEYGAAMW